MTAQAILPANPADPTGQDKRERGAMAQMKRRCAGIRRGVLDVFAQQSYEVATFNAEHAAMLVNKWAAEDCQDGIGIAERTRELWHQYNATEYRYLLDETILSRINSEISSITDQWLLEGGPSNLWLWNQYVFGAYQQGTALAQANLAVQSSAYKISRPDLNAVLMSDPYRRRIGLVRARVFEEMRGLSEDMKGDLGSVLARGMAAGLNPREIAKEIEKRVGVKLSLANTIARTEITSALKNARLAEDQSAFEDLGIRTKQMHFSALSPTTRPDHAARHGNLYEASEVKAWRNRDANDINCKCSDIAVVVDDNGNPYNDAVIKRAKAIKAKHDQAQG